ncbi:MAG: hypothetical protein DLM60_23385 [Pseudonocardiales bacterium]|nr:hypothetical protein [Actinomycetota bacterium]PZS11936.1 MAG: hypothetical protein DLM60_23385 [Pseudonocardiales bacterium]
MPTQIKHGHDVDGADTTTQQVHDLMIELVRQGQNTSLRSLQVWADLARQLGPTAMRPRSSATMVSLAYDLFEKLLATQRQVVDELVITQRQLVQRYVDTTATSVNKPTPR